MASKKTTNENETINEAVKENKKVRLVNVTKRELVNIKNASEKVDDYLGTPIDVKGISIVEEDVTNKETGEIETKPVVSFVTTDGHYISSPSATLVKFGEDVADVIEDENADVNITIVARKSNNGRTFYTGVLN